MLDKVLIEARKLADSTEKLEQLSTGTPDDAGIKAAAAQAREAVKEICRLSNDYFNPGRSNSHCKSCGAPLVWIKTRRGSNMPLDAAFVGGLDEGGVHRRIRINHFATCPQAASHKT